MDDNLNKLKTITAQVDSPLDRALYDILTDYKKKQQENEVWKADTQSIINRMEDEYHLECENRDDDYYVEPPVTSMDYIEAYHENQGAYYVEKSLGEELMALNEMQIIYSFKQIEISLKKFILLLKPEIDLKIVQRWDSLKEEFKRYGVKLGEVKSFTFINQLREVNNALKHSPEVTAAVKKMNIKEFSGLSVFTPESLTNFHSRVPEHKKVFLNSVAYAVGTSLQINSDDLYWFSMDSEYEKDMGDIPF
jgi:hypothetical protein